ncbi:MAG: hypothetical protein HYX32_13955, partial [Actinobacteria bacterium]|nr:hypothetical protein [Actinomycetota bacterium]
TTISYLADGRTDTIARPNGVITTNTYDPAGRLDGITHRNGTGAELQKFAYTLDENGNRVAQRWSTNSGPQTTETYSLDELSRLTGVNYGDSTSETFAYNPDGTRKTRTAIGGPTPGVTNYQYDNAQQLTSVDGTAVPGGSQTFTYDNNGNLTSSSRSPLAAQPATPPRPVDPPTRISEEPTSASRSRRCRVQSLRRSLS